MLEDFDFRLPDAAAADRACYFIYRRQQLLWPGGRGIPRALTPAEWNGTGLAQLPAWYFGSFRGLPCYAVAAGADTAAPAGSEWIPLRQILIDDDAELFLVAGRGRQILEFHQTHRYCGCCGAPTRAQEREIALRCDACGHVFYPRVSPCIIVLVTRGEELLLARSARFPNAMYSTLAGFVEPGETLEQAVHREVLEEVGIQIGGLRYFGSQAWPFPHQLMIGYHAHHVSGAIRLDDEEIVDAHWWHYTRLPLTPPAQAMSGMLIRSFIDALPAG